MVLILTVILTVTVSWAQRNSNSAWFMTLPNERLEGVPSNILKLEKNFPSFKDSVLKFVGKTGQTRKTINAAIRQQRAQAYIGESILFPCNVSAGRSEKKPTTVHALRPGDIDVVAAMGDSLTAGSGAYALNMIQVATENRGVSSFIGGQGTWQQHLTLPNIIKLFNPKLIGYSLGDSFTHHKASQFNVAEIAAMGQDMPFMAKELVKRIKNDPRVDFKNDWKLVTLLIGSNNFCSDICYLENSSKAVENHRQDIIKSFRYLRDNMPRTIVNWIQSINLKILTDLVHIPAKCQLTHRLECPCLFSYQFRSRRKEFFSTMVAWQRMEEEVANDEQFRKTDDFTIVLQTCLKNLTIPMILDRVKGHMKTDVTYMSYDCFHLSQKGYSRISNAIWNNLLEPVGSKSINAGTEFQTFSCPTKKFPYIFTWKNSQSRSHIYSL